ncbi:MAG: FAD-binding protein [Phycisphaerae bacterium]|nr:FAD-binding protein [Phycisphaerae bacterium]
MAGKLEQLKKDLGKSLSGGPEDVRTDILTRIAFSTDSSIYQILPLCVVMPRTVEDVAAVIRYAGEHGIPIAARGAGSGLAGEALTGGIVIHTARHMKKILGVQQEGEVVVCQPGVVLDELNAYLAPFGRKIGPDPSSGNRAVIGGIIANNATGAHSLQYGYIADWIERLQVVLADGSLAELTNNYDPGLPQEKPTTIHRITRNLAKLLEGTDTLIEEALPKTRRNRSGYRIKGVYHEGRLDLAKLMAGSEGTLGIITEATLRTVGLPKCKALLQVEFESFDRMARAVPLIVDTKPAACELMDRTLIEMALKAYPQYADVFMTKGAASLMIEHVGRDRAEVEAGIVRTEAAVKDLICSSMRVFDAKSQQRLWQSRKDAVPLLNRDKGPSHPIAFIEDVAVEHSKLGVYITGLQKIGAEYDIPMAFYGHAGDGELHIRPYVDLSRPEEVQRMVKIANEVFELAWSLGGSISGEHADGLLRAAFIKRQYGDSYYQILRHVKELFDPTNLMNPGKVINDDPEVMTKNLRMANLPMPERLKTNLLFAPDEFRFEIDQCNGDGVCLSCRPGSRMCPVFRALGEETSCSRGKANLMRAWITGLLTEKDLASDAFKTILGHCVNCKMCTIECPAGVDISKLVIEARAEVGKRRGFRRAELALARNRMMSVLGSVFAPLSNWVLDWRLPRYAMQRLIGLDRMRPLPKFQRGSFLAKSKLYLQTAVPVADPIDRVAYFVDSFANFNDHDLGFAVLKLLRHNGIDVVVPDQRPAPLPAFVYGDLKTARKEAGYSLRSLSWAVKEGRKILCSEPSAALFLREELRLLDSSEDARQVSENTFELMSYLENLRSQGRLKPLPDRSSSGTSDGQEWKILLHSEYAYHAPCHLCAMRAQGSSVSLLGAMAGVKLTDLRAGCCGLAGTFGMQRKNRELSAQIGKDMAQAIIASPSPVVLTECATCKMQIEYLTGKMVAHPAKILAILYGLMD